MEFKLSHSIFEQCVELHTEDKIKVSINDCIFRNFSHFELHLRVITKGNCVMERSIFSDLVCDTNAGYRIESEAVIVSDVSMNKISQGRNNIKDGGVQIFLCTDVILRSSNVTNTNVNHICLLATAYAKTASVSFLNAVDDSAPTNGVGAQFHNISDVATLQFANFIRVSSPKFGIVRCVYSSILYAVRCFFSGIENNQKAFYGESPIKVFSSSSDVSSLLSLRVSIFDLIEMKKEIEIFIESVRPLSRCSHKLKSKLICFSLVNIIKFNFLIVQKRIMSGSTLDYKILQ